MTPLFYLLRNEWKLDTDFDVGNALGQGAFGHVYLARTKRENFLVALKVLHMKQIVEQNLQTYIQRELDIHGKLE